MDRDQRREAPAKELRNFEQMAKVGEGSFGQVYKVRDRQTSEVMVMKMVQLNGCNPNDLIEKYNEIKVMKGIKHPYINRFKYSFSDSQSQKLCILFELCDKGDLQEYINNQKGFSMSEVRIKRFLLELLLAIEFLHSHDIIHRDLKPSNIFLKGKDYTVQVGDFGIACNLDNGTHLRVEDVGTLLYQSPEVLAINSQALEGQKQGYDHRCDIWSFGCIVF